MSKNASRLPNKLPFVLMGGHICVDACQGGLASVLPFLVIQSGFSYTEITALVLASNSASAIIQPLFGWLGDKKARPWLMAVGVALAGIGLALVGVLQSYWLVVAAAMISGIGNAMLHPEGARLANLTGGDDKAVSMSVFSVGGQIGFCLGPVISVAAITAFGLAGTLVYLVICIPYALVLLALTPKFRTFGVRAAAQAAAGVRDRWGAFSVVLGALSVRSIVFYGVTSFFPLYLVATFGASEDAASLLITVFSVCGAFATAASGMVSHRIPTPRLMVGCFALMALALVAFVTSGNVWLCVVAVMVLAPCVNLFNPPAVALGQSYLPAHLGMASGLSFGVAVAVGGIASPLLGVLGDGVGLVPVIWILVACAAAGLVFSLGVLANESRFRRLK
ncbi:MFS transporter [Senegalimassilia faecalis]|uniref:MFS transporter n=1 Tax=Senegalimassilia faecalis TaxID=2509433 RepID=A0A4Q2K1L5_9ACTN|nr:MFS transporter [Senegalimassilia faecalis]RXZ53444.1 MFS transporter [Senegalimassilia faecalis]